MDEPKPQVTFEVVEATMSSPLFRDEVLERAAESDILPDVPDSLPAVPELPRISIDQRAELGVEIAIAAVVALAAALLAADARVAVVVGSLGFAIVGFRRIEQRHPFSFGEGFIGYRSNMGWPRGVQEDDDVHWNWTRRAPDPRDSAG